MSDKRTAHPYFMYDAIREQPERIARLLGGQHAVIEQAAAAAAGRRRVWLAGTGSSYHAAQVGEHCVRHFTGGAADAHVEQSFELLHYPPKLGPDDAMVVISHRGAKGYSVEVLRAAKVAGALTIAVTGDAAGDAMRAADFVFITCEQEVSFAHTKSYTTALAALALFSIRLAERRGFLTQLHAGRAVASLERVPELVRQALGCEPLAREAARDIAARQRWVFLGAGPNWATAREGALKVKETCYIPADGFQTEQFLHGAMAETDARTALTAILAGGPGDHRTVAALRAAGEIGLLRVVSASRGAFTPADAKVEHLLEVPEVAEWLSPFLHTVTVQLLSYGVALERGTNPDTGRLDQPAHARAHDLYKL